MKLRNITCICLASCLLFSGSVFASDLNSEKKAEQLGINERIGNMHQQIVGASSQRVWSFDAKATGTFKIQFSYSRPWGKNVSALKTVEYTIEVTENSKNDKDTSVLTLAPDVINKLEKGQKFNITLEENASTGYSWNYSANSDVIQLIENENKDENININIKPIKDVIRQLLREGKLSTEINLPFNI